MRFAIPAPPIILMSCLLALAGCEDLGFHDPFLADQVPDDVRAEPRLVSTPPPQPEQKTWPRLGDVPIKPRDFSPKPAYDHYMDELEYHRAEADAARDKLEAESPAAPDGTPPGASPSAALPSGSAPQTPVLMPPQLPQTPKE